jgi:predicted ester cyclase
VGIPATEKRITLTGIHIHRVAGEKIVGLGEEIDLFGLMQQLGALGRNQ